MIELSTFFLISLLKLDFRRRSQHSLSKRQGPNFVVQCRNFYEDGDDVVGWPFQCHKLAYAKGDCNRIH